MEARAFDVVVYGATGFTGGLVAEYLAQNVRGVRWAIAGRDQSKLERVRERLRAHDARLDTLPLLIADAQDAAALRRLAGQTKVVATTAGPFALHGSELVAACVERGTHYCDLSGEMQWIARIIARHHGAAQAKGVRIVNACGYDSLPSDLGALIFQQHALATHGRPASELHGLAHVKGPNLSGGTFASMFNLVEEAQSDRAVRRLLFDPHGLAPNPRELTGSRREQRGVGYVADADVFTGPFMMAPANVRIVHRSNALLDFLYGRDFVYAEAMPTGKGAAGASAAALLAGGMAALQVGIALPPLRGLIRRLVPKPGAGPSEQARQRGSFAHEFYGTVDGKHLRATFAADGDPGYGETAKMIAESALCLALDKLTTPGGVLTGASAMGPQLIARLQKVGFRIQAWTA